MQRHKVLSSQFGLTSGIRQESSDFIALPSHDRIGRLFKRKGRLWIFAEPAAPSGGASAAAKLVTETVESEYYQSPAPNVTGALEDAIRTANRLLYDYNSGAPAHKQAFLGLTCVVVQGKQAYVAQVQPARAILVHQGTPRTFPEAPIREDVDLTPLGLEPEVEVEFGMSVFAPSDTISVLSRGLAAALGSVEDEYTFSYQDHKGAVEELYHLAARHNLMDEHALVIESPPKKSVESVGKVFRALGREWLGNAATSARDGARGLVGRLFMPSSDAAEESGTAPSRAALFLRRGREGASAASRAWRVPRRSGRGRGLKIALSLVGVLLLLVLAGGLGYRTYQSYQREAKLNALIRAAEQQRAEAHGKPAQSALQHLQTAKEYLADARKLDPKRARISTTLQRINADWATVNKVESMNGLRPLRPLPGYRPGTASKLLVLGGKAYVLSEPPGRVTEYDLKGGGHRVISPGRSSRIEGLSWRIGGLILLDRSGRLFDYDLKSGRWSSVKLGGKRNWSQVASFDTYGTTAYVAIRHNNGVYVYDTQAPTKSKVWRSKIRHTTLDPASISANGDLWVINRADGSLWLFVNGNVSRRLWVEAEPPIHDAFGLVALDSNRYLYMLDATRQRVLQVTKTGQLKAQLTLPSRLGSQRIDAIYPDEKAGKLYVVAGRTLYSMPLRGGKPRG